VWRQFSGEVGKLLTAYRSYQQRSS